MISNNEPQVLDFGWGGASSFGMGDRKPCQKKKKTMSGETYSSVQSSEKNRGTRMKPAPLVPGGAAISLPVSG